MTLTEMPSISLESCEMKISLKFLSEDYDLLHILETNILNAIPHGNLKLILSSEPENGMWLLTLDLRTKKIATASKLASLVTHVQYVTMQRIYQKSMKSYVISL